MVGKAVTLAGYPVGYTFFHCNGPGGGLGDRSIGLRGTMLHTEVWKSHLALSTPRGGTVDVAGQLAAPITQYP